METKLKDSIPSSQETKRFFMGKIFIIMGKSASGKDTVLKNLLTDETLKLSACILYTTRPMRAGEADGVSYHFRDEAHLKLMTEQKLLIEQRTYPSMHGDWHYYMADDGKLDLASYDYCLIGTIDSYVSIKDYYGPDCVIPIMIECDDGVRLQRALNRELKQDEPKYSELCRRYLADEQDFSEAKKAAAGIMEVFENKDIGICTEKIKEKILYNNRKYI